MRLFCFKRKTFMRGTKLNILRLISRLRLPAAISTSAAQQPATVTLQKNSTYVSYKVGGDMFLQLCLHKSWSLNKMIFLYWLHNAHPYHSLFTCLIIFLTCTDNNKCCEEIQRRYRYATLNEKPSYQRNHDINTFMQTDQRLTNSERLPDISFKCAI